MPIGLGSDRPNWKLLVLFLCAGAVVGGIGGAAAGGHTAIGLGVGVVAGGLAGLLLMKKQPTGPG
jgi:hypothetical protein